MKAITSLFSILLLPVLFSACSGNNSGDSTTHADLVGNDPSPTQPEKPFNPTRPSKFSVDEFYGMNVDPGMPAKKRSVVLSRMKDFHSEPFTTDDSTFDKVFGGNDNVAVIDFISERAQFITHQAINMSEIKMSSAFMGELADKNSVILATNMGTGVWLSSFMYYPNGGKISVRGIELPIQSTRLGLIHLGEAFFMNRAFLQVSVLAHESRHSDCTGGLSANEYNSIRNACMSSGDACQKAFNSFRQQRPECGHAHSLCPANHQLAGEPACDSHQWGSYAVDAVFYTAMEKYCEKNCNEKTRQELSVAKKDAYTRLQDLNGYLNGTWSTPDMETGPIFVK